MRRFAEIGRGRIVFVLVAIAVGLVTLNACLKDEEGLNQVSAVAALNAVPGSEGLDIGLDNNQLNQRVFAYGDTIPYLNAWPGRRLVRVFEVDRGPTTAPEAQGTVDFTPGKFYSLYVVVYEDIELMTTEDDLSSPGEGRAKIRFINLSPDAPSLDFGAASIDTLLASGRAFKSVTKFSMVDAGETYTFHIMEHNNDQKVLHTFDFTPESNMIYTVWAKGLFEPTDNELLDFGHGIITH